MGDGKISMMENSTVFQPRVDGLIGLSVQARADMGDYLMGKSKGDKAIMGKPRENILYHCNLYAHHRAFFQTNQNYLLQQPLVILRASLGVEIYRFHFPSFQASSR